MRRFVRCLFRESRTVEVALACVALACVALASVGLLLLQLDGEVMPEAGQWVRMVEQPTEGAD